MRISFHSAIEESSQDTGTELPTPPETLSTVSQPLEQELDRYPSFTNEYIETSFVKYRVFSRPSDESPSDSLKAPEYEVPLEAANKEKGKSRKAAGCRQQ